MPININFQLKLSPKQSQMGMPMNSYSHTRRFKYRIFYFQAVSSAATGQQAKPEAEGQIKQLTTNLQNVINNATTVLQGNLPESKEVVKTLNQGAQNLANGVQDFVNKIKTEVRTGLLLHFFIINSNYWGKIILLTLPMRDSLYLLTLPSTLRIRIILLSLVYLSRQIAAE